MTARDFAQTLALCERFGIDAHGDRPPPRRPARRRRRSASRSARGALVRWARRHGRVRPRARPRLQRRHGRRRAAADPVQRRRSTTSGRPSSTTSTAASRRRSSCPRRSRRSGSRATARRGKLHRYPGLKEEYYLADFEPDPAVLDELGLDATQPIVVVRTPPAVSLYHRFEHDTFGAVLQRLRDEGAQAVVLPRTPEQRAELTRGRRLHDPRARDRRAVADRLRRPRRSPPAAR